jgi:arsenate reductase
MKMYGIQNCDTIKKARQFLDKHKIQFEFIDFRENPLDEVVLQSFIDSVDWAKLINKRSTTYRNLNEAQRANITPAFIIKNPTLIKRPVLVNGDEIRVGFSEKSYADLI